MGRIQRLALAAGLVLGAASIGHVDARIVPRANNSSSPLSGDFAKFVEENLDFWKIPGMAIAVVDGQRVSAEVRAAPRRALGTNMRARLLTSHL